MQLEAIHADLLRLERQFGPQLAECALHKESARNLIHYLALRRHDIRELQEELAALGLSSLSRTESHVLAGIEAVLKLLNRLTGREWMLSAECELGFEFAKGKILLRANTDALLGPRLQKRKVRIMVTVPREAAENYQFVRQLLASGMNCMRINCAHDDAEAWSAMIANLQRAKQELELDCRVEMDFSRPEASHRINRSRDTDREMAPATRHSWRGRNTGASLADADRPSRADARSNWRCPDDLSRAAGENAQRRLDQI